jgi:hypothetical protein
MKMFDKIEKGVIFVVNFAEKSPDYYKNRLDKIWEEYSTNKEQTPEL